MIDTSSFFVPVSVECDRYREDEPISLSNLSWVRYNARHNRDCLGMMDEETAAHEVGIFAQAGGGTIIDLTCREMGRNPVALARISRRTRVNIIVGTGYYTAGTHPHTLSQAHIIERVIPYMRIYGYSEDQIRQLTRINPARMLSGNNAFIHPQTKKEELK